MRTTGAATPGYRHEIGFYSSEEEFHDLIVPFAVEALGQGEPVVFAYDAYKTDLLRSWLVEDAAVTHVSGRSPYSSPARALAAWRAIAEQEIAAGAPRVRVAGDVPHPGYGVPYVGWDRYEAAIDTALGHLPVWARCCYDTRIAPADVLALAGRLHRHRIEPSGRQSPNPGFAAVLQLGQFLAPVPEPLEQSPPTVELVAPTPVAARSVVDQVARSRVGDAVADDLRQAVSEVVANGVRHGLPPVVVRVWAGTDRVVVHVHDAGGGPADPLVGLVPVDGDGSEAGRGLWLSHLLDVDVALLPSDDGFTVRLDARAAG